MANQQSHAVSLFTKASAQGHGDASFMTALCYEQGRGVAANSTMAMKYYYEGAMSDHPGCQYNYGVCLRKGKGKEAADHSGSIAWIRRAAKQGHLEALYTCGLDSYLGRGVKQCYATAYLLFEARAHVTRPRSLKKCPASKP